MMMRLHKCFNKKLFTVLRIAMILILTFSMTASSAACSLLSDNAAEGINIVGGLAESFVCGGHNNFSYYGALQDPSVKEEAFLAAYNYADVSIFVIDSDPFLVFNDSVPRPKENVDNEKRRLIAETVEGSLLKTLASDQVMAHNPEADTLKAITISANTLQDSTCGTKRMIVLDSGLSTSGYLNFATQNIIERDPGELVSYLKTQNAIPNLEGIDLIWIGLGQVNDIQCTLSSDYIYKLSKIWEAILKEGGANVEIHVGALQDYQMEHKLPAVSTVPVIVNPATGVTRETIDSASAGGNGINTYNETGISEKSILSFTEDETAVHFEPDTAVFIDESAAKEELEPVAGYLVTNPEATMYVAGMTATFGSAESSRQLSLERANAVKSLILQSDSSITESQLRILGLGYETNPLRVPDIIDGKFREEYAKKNRAVYLIGEDADILPQLIRISESF